MFAGKIIRDLILRHGDYVLMANTKGEKWFMRIVNGKVFGTDTEDPVFASALVNPLGVSPTMLLDCLLKTYNARSVRNQKHY